MAEGALRVVKIPVPNSASFCIRIKGHLVECLEFQAQIFKDSGIVLQNDKPQMKIAVFVWAMIIEAPHEETHEFVMVHTGQEFPPIDGEIRYVSSAMVPIPDGEIEMHLFHAGLNEDLASLDIPMGNNED